MINGRFSDDDTLIFELSLIASDGLELPTDVLLNTGFSGWLAIDEQDCHGLGWTYLRTVVQQTARGVSDFDIYAGKVRLDGSEFDILVHVGEGLTEVLFGLKWLKTRRLVVDMALGVLTLGDGGS
jgi:predicted aspartyl protease